MPQLPAWLVPALLICAGYFVPAALASEWSLIGHGPPAIWPAAGIGVAALAMAGLRYWPAVAVAMLMAFTVTENHHSLAMQVVLSLGKAAAVAAGAVVLRRGFAGRQMRLGELRDLGAVCAAAIVAALVGAVTGSATFWAEGQTSTAKVPQLFITWFMGDMLGVILFGSFVLAWQRDTRDEWRRSEWAKFAAGLGVTAAVTWLVYFSAPRPGAFYLFPILVWVAFTMRAAGATAALAIMSLMAVAGTSNDLGPFSRASGVGDIFLMQQFLTVATSMTLLLAVVWEERRAEALTSTRRAETLAESRLAELTSLYESAPIGLAYFNREHEYLRINEQLARVNGWPAADHIGHSVREVLPAHAEPLEQVIDEVFATGEPISNVELIAASPAAPDLIRHWLLGFYPVRNDDGEVESVGAWVLEVSERKKAEERETLLAREVDHRAKNLLAVVQSVVQLTRAKSASEFKDAITGRIQALARAHSLLADARWDGAQLGKLVSEELAPYRDEAAGRIRVDGPELLLRPSAAQSLAMVLHELATNAAKYGALSESRGRLDVHWSRQDEEIKLVWTETDGPAAIEPQTSGFGSKIMQASIERQLHGSIEQNWRPEGLQCIIRISAREALGFNEPSPA